MGAGASAGGGPAGTSKAKSSKYDLNGMPKKGTVSFGYPRNFRSIYGTSKELGHGQFGTVYECYPKKRDPSMDPGKKLAVKLIDKSKFDSPQAVEDVRREVLIMAQLRNMENVVEFQGSFEDDEFVYIVMEKCEGGELFDRIIKKGKYTEKDAAVLVSQMLKVIAECHLQGIIHRDLKPENFLFATPDEDSIIKATDFGLSEFFRPGVVFKEVVGSAYYVAPEVLRRSYGYEADVWSIGVIIYILLSGMPPFYANTEMGIFKEILHGQLHFRAAQWKNVSPSAIDLIQKILTHDVKSRYTAAQALAHPWFGEAPDIPLDIRILDNLKRFRDEGKLKKAAQMALAQTLNEEEIKAVKAQFEQIDKDGNGQITVQELRDALQHMEGISEEKAAEILEGIDANNDGTIDIQEFIAATLNFQQLQKEDFAAWTRKTKQAFAFIDIDGNGYLTVDELKHWLKEGGTGDEEILEAIEEADANKDGKISYEEFVDNILKRNPSDVKKRRTY
eukprot:scaffold569_cov408-Prasinococcus_capsulatus_cf.AAC.41